MVSEKDFLKYIAEELELSEQDLSMKDVFREIPNWTSLNALLVVSRINDEADVLLSTSELANCVSLEDIYTLVNEKT